MLSKLSWVSQVSFTLLVFFASSNEFPWFSIWKEGKDAEIHRWSGPNPELNDRWLLCKVLKNNFWAKANEKPISAVTPFEHIVDEDEDEDEDRIPLPNHMYHMCLKIIIIEKEHR